MEKVSMQSKVLFSSFIRLSFLFSSGAALAADPSPVEILKQADRARGSTAVSEGISWQVKVDSVGATTDASTITYDLKVKGQDALAEAIAPPRNKGAREPI